MPASAIEMPISTDSTMAQTASEIVRPSPAAMNWMLPSPLAESGLKMYQPQV